MGRKAFLGAQGDLRSVIAATLLWCEHKAAARIECPLLCSRSIGGPSTSSPRLQEAHIMSELTHKILLGSAKPRGGVVEPDFRSAV